MINSFIEKVLIIVLIFFVHCAIAQKKDDFSSSNFSTPFRWQGDTNLFVKNGGLLKSNGANAANQIIAIATQNVLAIEKEWTINIKLNFAPSATNVFRFYLQSNLENLKSTLLNGYFIQIGETNRDTIKLFRQNGTVITKIKSSPRVCFSSTTANYQNVRIKVSKLANGDWKLETDCAGSTNYSQDFIVNENTLPTNGYCGIYCRYATASRFNLFQFDDFGVQEIVFDTIKPKADKLEIISAKKIKITFSEKVDSTTVNNINNYSFNNNINPIEILKLNHTQYQLSFSDDFVNPSNNILEIKNINDLFNNSLTTVVKDFIFIIPKEFDIVINEFLPDPTPVVGLPEYEFVELKNNSKFPIELKKWKINSGSDILLPTFTIEPDSFVVLCSTAAQAFFQSLATTIGVTSFPVLTNNEDVIILKDSSGKIIHQISYQDNWHTTVAGKDGGFSLEAINGQSLCIGKLNWKTSEHLIGGTPGKINSVNSLSINNTKPSVKTLNIKDTKHIQLIFDSKVNQSTLNISVSPSRSFTYTQSFIYIDTLNLVFDQELDKGKVFDISIKNGVNCLANVMNEYKNSFILSFEIDSSDILINEILFNPKIGGSDFVEIYNKSSKILDLKNLQIANLDNYGNIDNIKPISTNSLLIYPKDYLVLTVDPENIMSNYATSIFNKIIKLTSMPSLNIDNGNVVLLKNNIQKIDEVYYDANYHFKLLKEVKGVSLERISFENSSQNSNNWFSASTTTGYASPCVENSQYVNDVADNKNFSVDPPIISPDQDGFKDFATLSYQFPTNGFTGNITIFNTSGQVIKNIVSNHLFSKDGFYIWDGLDNNNQKLPQGAYIVLFEAFDLGGKQLSFKSRIVITYR